jgi:excinuclease ABC subunit A
MGLGYLTLDRLTHTLSGGEFQRINLSTALGSSLVGTLYVLDEPSTGMHPSDTDRLIKILKNLRNIGNTILVVEHDPDIMKQADFVIDVGPKAGSHGGEILYSGDFENLLKDKKSLTGKYLSGKEKIKYPSKDTNKAQKFLTIINAQENNLKVKEVSIPQDKITVVTGVSGSGKSTLIHDILYAGMKKSFGSFNGHIGKYERIDGWDDFTDVEMVDQSPIGRSSRSTPATFTKAFDLIREVFSKTQIAKQLGLKAGYFSFNVAGGRCDVCEGEGLVTIEMQFLSDVKLTCENCNGTRYKQDVKNVKYKDKSIIDVLEMTIDEAIVFFKDEAKIVRKLQVLSDVGLGYLKIGQPSTMLSGGEAQRIKLAINLEKTSTEKKLFIFDEPTTGLHIDDISKLLKCFTQLKQKGNTVVIIEHNLSVMAFGDYIIDLGPEAGSAGGEVVAVGTPDEIVMFENTHTAKSLKQFYEEEGLLK